MALYEIVGIGIAIACAVVAAYAFVRNVRVRKS